MYVHLSGSFKVKGDLVALAIKGPWSDRDMCGGIGAGADTGGNFFSGSADGSLCVSDDSF